MFPGDWLLLDILQVKTMLNELNAEWVKFQEKLIEAEGMLKKHKVCYSVFH